MFCVALGKVNIWWWHSWAESKFTHWAVAIREAAPPGIAGRQLGSSATMDNYAVLPLSKREKPQAGRLFLPMGAFHGAA